MSACLMCGSADSLVSGQIPVHRIDHAYNASFETDVHRLFPANADAVNLNICGSCGLRWYSPTVPGDESFYENLQKISWYYQDYKPEYEFAKLHISEGNTVLEVGCGKGAFSRFLQKNIHYRGLEFNEAAVKKARAVGLDVEAVPLNKEAAERQEFYDVVCHFQVLEHVSDPKSFLCECVKALSPGGKMIIAVPSEDSFLSLVENGWLNMPPHHLTRWTDKALTSALNNLGLQIQEIWHEPVASFHTDWYQRVMINAAIKRFVGAAIDLEADRLWSKVSLRVSNIPIIRDIFFRLGEKSFPFSGRGHSVCVVALKQA
jgi:2-polyprenyl-3-methyl-5-hydroxy-6-metoxy-1,4-benzoquinol methylase